MNYCMKLKLIILAFFTIFIVNATASDLLPKPKPKVDQEIKAKVDKKKEIIPKKKPGIKKEINKTAESDEVEKSTKEQKKQAFIYPQKKPIIVQKKIDKIVLKSQVLSKKDFQIAKASFEAIDNKKWQTALKLSKKAKDKTVHNLVNYLYLIRASNSASFYDYTSFINKNPDYPRISRLKYLAEHKINLKTNSPKFITKWFGENEPLSSYGKIKLGEIYLLQGDI